MQLEVSHVDVLHPMEERETGREEGYNTSMTCSFANMFKRHQTFGQLVATQISDPTRPA